MKKFFSTGFILALGLALPLAARAGKINGYVRLPTGEMIPPSAAVQVELRDVSKADANAMLLGRDEQHGGGKTEMAYEISYDDSKVAANHTYAVSCRIIARGKLLYINNTQVAVITRGAPVKDVDIPVAKVKN